MLRWDSELVYSCNENTGKNCQSQLFQSSVAKACNNLRTFFQGKWLNLGKYNKSCSVCNLPYSHSASPSFLVALETTAAQPVNSSSLASIREQRTGLEFLESPISSELSLLTYLQFPEKLYSQFMSPFDLIETSPRMNNFPFGHLGKTISDNSLTLQLPLAAIKVGANKLTSKLKSKS